jgi:hypothetical protein
MRPSRQPRCGFLRMTRFLNSIMGLRHGEERRRRVSNHARWPCRARLSFSRPIPSHAGRPGPISAMGSRSRRYGEQRWLRHKPLPGCSISSSPPRMRGPRATRSPSGRDELVGSGRNEPLAESIFSRHARARPAHPRLVASVKARTPAELVPGLKAHSSSRPRRNWEARLRRAAPQNSDAREPRNRRDFGLASLPRQERQHMGAIARLTPAT